MNFRLRLGIVILILIVGQVSYGQRRVLAGATEDDIFGAVSEGIYHNDFLGFELSVPKDWIALTTDETNTAKKIGVEGLKNNKKRNDKAVEKAASIESVVLAYSKKPLGSVGNSVIALGVARQPSSSITPKMVVEAAKSILLLNPKNKLVEDTKTEEIGGKQFASFIVDLDSFGQTLRLKYYATMIRSFSLTVNLSVGDPESAKVSEASLRSIKFHRK